MAMATARLLIPIDKAGRVVLPKEIRDRLGIRSGTEFEVTEEEKRIILRPVEKEPQTIIKDGLIVVVPVTDFTRYTEEDPIQAARAERDRKFL